MLKKVIFIIIIGLTLSCGKEAGDILSVTSETPEDPVVPVVPEPFLVLAGQDGNHRGLTFYDLNGNFIRATDFREESGLPKGMLPLDSQNFLVAVDTNDAIYSVNELGEKTIFHGSAQLSGAIYGIVRDSNDLTYVIESNRIEVFDPAGLRLAANYITTTVGGCTLNSPRDLVFNTADLLVATDATGTDELLFYDVSGGAPVCDSTVPFPNDPHGLLQHSDGFLYITTLLDDQVYRTDADGSNPTVVWATDLTIIRDPTDIIELPNGNLLVSSSFHDTIEEITTAGVRVGTTPFIRDSHSQNTSSMVIVGGASE